MFEKRWQVSRPVAALMCTLALSGCGQRSEPPDWSGYVEAEYTYVSPAVSGTLMQVDVTHGQSVAAGALLFTLDDEAEQAALLEAQARRTVALAQAANADKGKRPDERAIVRAQVAQAREQATLAQSELSRQRSLVSGGFVSPTRIDALLTAVSQAQAKVRELEASLRVATLPARDDEREAAHAQVLAAEQALRAAQWRLAQRRVLAPVGGMIAQTYRRVGETAQAGQPVLALWPSDAVRARFFVPETAIGSVHVGDPVRIRCDGCAEPIDARIDFIATEAEYTPPVIYSNAQRSRLVFMVEARAGAAQAARLRPGLPIDVFAASAR